MHPQPPLSRQYKPLDFAPGAIVLIIGLWFTLTQMRPAPQPAPAIRSAQAAPAREKYVPCAGRLFPGTEIYLHIEPRAPEYWGTVVDLKDQIVLIQLDKSTEWKDRKYIINSGLYVVDRMQSDRARVAFEND
jgi:hypothetical protein